MQLVQKNQMISVSQALLAIPGLSLYLSLHPSQPNLSVGGMCEVSICICEEQSQSASAFVQRCPLYPKLINHCLPNSLYAGRDKLLIGCLCRSPSHNQIESTELCQLLHAAGACSLYYLLLGRYFNMAHIDRESHDECDETECV